MMKDKELPYEDFRYHVCICSIFSFSQAVISSHYILYHFHGFLEAYWLQPVGAVAYFYTH